MVESAAEVVRGITAVVTFLGRNELGAQAEPILLPFFFQIERSDVYDASVGLRGRFAERGIVSALPTLEVEYAF